LVEAEILYALLELNFYTLDAFVLITITIAPKPLYSHYTGRSVLAITPVNNWRTLLKQRCTARMRLLIATGARFGRCHSSSQWRLCTITTSSVTKRRTKNRTWTVSVDRLHTGHGSSNVWFPFNTLSFPELCQVGPRPSKEKHWG